MKDQQASQRQMQGPMMGEQDTMSMMCPMMGQGMICGSIALKI